MIRLTKIDPPNNNHAKDPSLEGLLRERQHKESKKAYRALIDYCRMGSNRSLRKLFDQYLKQSANIPLTTQEIYVPPPTSRWGCITTWSTRFGWVAASEQWDAEVLRREQAAYEAALAENEKIWREQTMSQAEVIARLSQRAREANGSSSLIALTVLAIHYEIRQGSYA